MVNLFSVFLGCCFGFYYAMSVEFLKKGSCVKKFGQLLLTDIITTIISISKLFEFLSNNQKVFMNIYIYISTILTYWIVVGGRNYKNIFDENKELKLRHQDDIYMECCGEKIIMTQEKVKELECMVDKIAEFEDELMRNSEIALCNMKPVKEFIFELCNSIVHKFFNNSEVQIYVKSIDNDIIVEGVNINKIKLDKYFIEYDYAKILLENGKSLVASISCKTRLKRKLKNEKDIYIIPIIIAEQPMWYIIIYINNKLKFENTVQALNFMKIEEKISKIVDKYQLDYQMKNEAQNVNAEKYIKIQNFIKSSLFK